jgi:hypothetical protein
MPARQWIAHVIAKLAGRFTGRARRARRTRSFHLELQPLEDRRVPATVVNVGTSFAGLDFNASGGTEPPDTSIAVGPNQVVETVNTTIAIYNKTTGALQSETPLATFFSPVGATANLFDPVVVYDPLAQRFIVCVAEEIDSPQQSYLDLAVSNSSDPTQGFVQMHRLNVLRHDAAGHALNGDYPTIGYNADAYVITSNMYPFGNSTQFDHVLVVTIPKSSVLGTNPSTFTDNLIDRPANIDFSLSAAQEVDAGPGAPIWFVEEDMSGSTGLNVVAMTNVLSANPSFTTYDLPVPAYAAAVSPHQPGGTLFSSGALDSRILGAELRGTTLVASQTVGSGADDHARWYQFTIASGTPALVQSGEIDAGAGVDTFTPAIGIAPNGAIGIAFIESSSSQFMSVYVAGRLPSDPVGTMSPPVLLQAGVQNYNGTRGGDYSGLGIDPVDGSFWGASEFANTESTNWGTWIAKLNLKFIQQTYPLMTMSSALTAGGARELFVVSHDHGLFKYQAAIGWTRIGGAGSIAAVSATTDASGLAVAFVVTSDHALYRYDDRSGWSAIGAPGTISAAYAGTDRTGAAVVYVFTTTDAFAEYSRSSGWSTIGAADTLLNAAPIGGGNVAVITADHSVFEYRGARWFRLTSSGFAGALAAITDPSGNPEVYVVTLDHALFVYHVQTGWTRLGDSGTIASVSAGSNAAGQGVLYALTTAGDFFRYSTASGWSLIGAAGTIRNFSATNSDQVFVVTADDSIFQFSPGSGWIRLTGSGFGLG